MDKKKITVVTGASGGFGKAFVELLLSEDAGEIWAVARSEEKLERLASEYGDRVKPLPMDLSERGSIDALREKLEREKADVKYLVNNAGFAKFAAYDDISVNESLNMIDLNVSAVVALTLTCLPHMSGGARIINVASQASFFPLPYMNIYAATKAFVKNYTRALNVELKDRKISATAVCPGWMDTGLFDRGNVGAEKGVTNFSHMKSPETVAKKALKDAKKGKDVSVCGSYVKFTHFLSKIIPQKTMMKLWLKQQKIK